jgi:glycosyltransferase involved in cell wall biosynthesis
MKICALETHSNGGTRTSAVDYWRVVNPLKHTKFDIDFKKNLIDDTNLRSIERSWVALGESYTLLYSSYIDTLKPYAYLRAIQQKYGLKHIMDLDDNIFDVDEMSPVALEYNPTSEKFHRSVTIINDADVMTVTTPELRDTLIKHGRTKPTYIMPNYIDLKLWDIRKEPKDTDKVNIVYFGSSTHYSDINRTGFLEACLMLHEKYGKKVKFHFMGMIPVDFRDKFPRGRVEYVGGNSDYYGFVELWKRISNKFDIAVAPLVHSDFNYSKSEIKFYEGAATRLPMVLSNTPNYKRVVKDDSVGFLVPNEPMAWFDRLDRLVKSKELRQNMGDNAYEHVKNNYTIDQHAYRWENLINEVCKC